jgi:hypothetical protein
MDDRDQFDEVPDDPNGSAYQKTEERTGPPLGYIAEKLQSSLLMLHEVVRSIGELVPDDLPLPTSMRESPYSLKNDYLLSPARSAFYDELVGFLALYNMLALAGDRSIVARLQRYTHDEFDEWLKGIERHGLVNG